jgi:uncharacterized protein YaaQ
VVTMLAGVEDDQVDAAVQVTREALPPKEGEKRATLFVVPVQNYVQV